MSKFDDARYKTNTLSRRIMQRTDIRQREILASLPDPDFDNHENYAISEGAWNHVSQYGIEPKMVFAHPDILSNNPELSHHFRCLALLSQKQTRELSGISGLAKWEDGSFKKTQNRNRCLKLARAYNAVISSMIEGSTDWTLENGYRNILATMGITMDGSFRNIIGRDAEKLVKDRILDWLNNNGLVVQEVCADEYELPKNAKMRFSSEPDISIIKDNRLVVTVEIKGGTDPAAALERLGAMQKSFGETPPGCKNFLVAGVVTAEMRRRIEEMGNVNVFELDKLSDGIDHWNYFMEELFHFAARIK